MSKQFKNRITPYEPLSSHTTFKIGGVARYWYEPHGSKELSGFLKIKPRSMPFFVIGAGSNLLIKEGLRQKVFIHLSLKGFGAISVHGKGVEVGAALRLGRLVTELSRLGFSGFEFLAGIPGTIGGAVVMNAGARMPRGSRSAYREMADIVSAVQCLDEEGRFFTLKGRDLKFSYRDSNLKPYIVLKVFLKLNTAKKGIVQERISAILRRRLTSQDWEHPSAGSFFKNPRQGKEAGRLIDACQLKGLRVRDAQVSLKHANFIINRGSAKSAHVLKLMAMIQENVYNKFKIKLEPEVEFVS